MTLIQALKAAIRRLHDSPRTEEAYTRWTREYIHFHKRRHPREMGARYLVPVNWTSWIERSASRNAAASARKATGLPSPHRRRCTCVSLDQPVKFTGTRYSPF